MSLRRAPSTGSGQASATKQSLCSGTDCFANFILSVAEGLAMTL